ncbi:MAG: 6-phosphogluconate dehydrogenase (decarboxylating) [Candidatus Lindowbacteria bacterium RIFCSPLOWO2_12_FULL_62_27]|nr:MAG: 6-phosphogluconate dehydrogenase (decarboxylating) [Candidatus Lindowbacteria bacterium RIFCSPLOWO2_12_FULL_62_27]
MQLGMVGLGRMGGNMVKRLAEGGHKIVAFDRGEDTVKEFARIKNVEGAFTLKELVSKMKKPRAIWVMVPAGKPTDETLYALADMCDKDDVLIDGGNSKFTDDARRAEELKKKGIHYMDVGTSGGIWGYKIGYCMMMGGDKEIFKRLDPIFKTLAPENGYIHCGKAGAGHFVKMVHNGIEYGMMQAYGEGFAVLHKSPFNLDLGAIAAVWNRGSVVRSWLCELLEDAFKADPGLANIKGYVEDTGEGRWTLQAAIDEDVPAPVLAMSLFTRFRSREEEEYADKVVAALRQQFGGHAVKTAAGQTVGPRKAPVKAK